MGGQAKAAFLASPKCGQVRGELMGISQQKNMPHFLALVNITTIAEFKLGGMVCSKQKPLKL